MASCKGSIRGRVGEAKGRGEVISGKEFRGCRCGVGNAPPGSSKGSRTDWLGKQKGRLKSAVEGQDSRYQNLGSGPRISEFVGGSLLPLPELLEGRVFLAHLVSLGPGRVSACSGHSVHVY